MRGVAGMAAGSMDGGPAELGVGQLVPTLPAAAGEVWQRIEAQLARSGVVDGVIAVGGGSSMDVAKVVAVLLGGDQALSDIYGVGRVIGGRLPLILVPTTAGTGSEVTPVAVITTGETTKAGVSSPVLLPDVALLDAALTLGLPPTVTAMTGVDAMVHAIEAYTSRHKKNPVSDNLAINALQLLSRNIRTAVREGGNQRAREEMLLGACLAGQAFANAPVAAIVRENLRNSIGEVEVCTEGRKCRGRHDRPFRHRPAVRRQSRQRGALAAGQVDRARGVVGELGDHG